MNFVERLLRPSALLDLANILKFTAISATLLERKIRCQNSHNLNGRGIPYTRNLLYRERKLSSGYSLLEANADCELTDRARKRAFFVYGEGRLANIEFRESENGAFSKEFIAARKAGDDPNEMIVFRV